MRVKEAFTVVLNSFAEATVILIYIYGVQQLLKFYHVTSFNYGLIFVLMLMIASHLIAPKEPREKQPLSLFMTLSFLLIELFLLKGAIFVTP